MRKAIIAAVAAVAAVGATPVIVAPPASACSRAMPGFQQCCSIAPFLAECGGHTQAPAPRPVQTPRPVQPPQAPHPAPTMPVQTPQVKPPVPPPPSVVPVQTPKINPPGTGAPKNAPLVTPPKHVDAPPQAIEAAKAAPATPVNPASPPQPPNRVDFNQQVQNVITNHGGNVDVRKVDNQELVRPRQWGFVDHDAYHRPTLYNPLSSPTTFHYTYNGAPQQVTVAAGGRIALNIATGAVFPFTAVSDSYVAAGSFLGGGWIPPEDWSGDSPPADFTPPADPTVYQDVSAYIPDAGQTVQAGQVTVVGHDDSQPTGSQDTFLLDDNTLAWGQIGASNGAQITVTKTQSLPGVSAPDNGKFLVALTAQQQPTDNTWWLWSLGGVVLVIAAGLVTWVVIRRKRSADLTVNA
jgi:hypothetical protein